MKGVRFIQILGLVVGVPLLVFAVCNNLWAEPEPERRVVPTVVVTVAEPAYTELLEELSVERLEEEDMTKQGEIDLLAACVEAEAGNQSLLGKRLVVDVVLNRVDSPDFPDSISEVIKEPGQFSVVESGAIDLARPSQDTWLAVYLELSGMRSDSEVVFFQAGGYGANGEPWGQIGAHYFSKERRGDAGLYFGEDYGE